MSHTNTSLLHPIMIYQTQIHHIIITITFTTITKTIITRNKSQSHTHTLLGISISNFLLLEDISTTQRENNPSKPPNTLRRHENCARPSQPQTLHETKPDWTTRTPEKRSPTQPEWKRSLPYLLNDTKHDRRKHSPMRNPQRPSPPHTLRARKIYLHQQRSPGNEIEIQKRHPEHHEWILHPRNP